MAHRPCTQTIAFCTDDGRNFAHELDVTIEDSRVARGTVRDPQTRPEHNRHPPGPVTNLEVTVGREPGPNGSYYVTWNAPEKTATADNGVSTFNIYVEGREERLRCHGGRVVTEWYSRSQGQGTLYWTQIGADSDGRTAVSVEAVNHAGTGPCVTDWDESVPNRP